MSRQPCSFTSEKSSPSIGGRGGTGGTGALGGTGGTGGTGGSGGISLDTFLVSFTTGTESVFNCAYTTTANASRVKASRYFFIRWFFDESSGEGIFHKEM